MRNAEKQWLSEKDHLLQELDKTAVHEQRKEDEIIFLNASNHGHNSSSSASLLLQENAYFEEERKKYEEEIQSLEQQHVQTHKLAEMYRGQVISLEEQLCKIREEGDVTREIYKVRRLTLSAAQLLVSTRLGGNQWEWDDQRFFSFEGSFGENGPPIDFVERSFQGIRTTP